MPAWLVPAIMGAVQLGSQLFGAKKQKDANMEMAKFQAAANERYLDKQLEYNTPANQMARFQDAGLNPRLIYGQGNPGNQSAPLQHPDVKAPDYQTLYGTVIPSITNSALAQSQIQAQQAKVGKDIAQTELIGLQRRVLEKNPALDATAFNAMMQSLVSTASIKMSQATREQMTTDWFTGNKSFQTASGALHGPAGIVKLEAEMQLLEQKFKLGSLDADIKAQVVNSKEFQNAILEVQKKFLADGEIGPEQIRVFIQLLLMKLL